MYVTCMCVCVVVILDTTGGEHKVKKDKSCWGEGKRYQIFILPI